MSQYIVYPKQGNNSFSTIQTPSGTSPTASSGADVLTFTSSDGSVAIIGDASTDTIDFTATATAISIPLNQVVYGTGTGVTSSSNFTFDGADLSVSAITANLTASGGFSFTGQFVDPVSAQDFLDPQARTLINALGATVLDFSSTYATGVTPPALDNTTKLATTAFVQGELPSVLGGVVFGNGTGLAQHAAKLFWDDTNERLGINTNAPATPFHLKSSGSGIFQTIESTSTGGGTLTSKLSFKNPTHNMVLGILDNTEIFQITRGGGQVLLSIAATGNSFSAASATAAAQTGFTITSSHANPSGTSVGLLVTTSGNNSGTGALNALRVNATGSYLGSGAQLLANFLTATVSKFTVDTSGNIVASGGGTFEGTVKTSALVASSNFASYGINAVTHANAIYQLNGSIAVFSRSAFVGVTSSALAAGSTYAAVNVATAPITTAGVGTHDLLANLAVKAVGTVTAGGAVITNTASLYIDGASSDGTNNYALWARSGNIRFDGQIHSATTLNKSFDANARECFDVFAVKSIVYGNREMYDSTGDLAINWDVRKMSKLGVTYYNWDIGMFYDASSVDSLDHVNRNAFDSSVALSIDWESRLAYDPLSAVSIDWNSRSLNDASGVFAIDWANRNLNDDAGNVVASWSGLASLGFFGATPVTQPVSSGAATAGALYTPTEQAMLQEVYDAVRALGLMS